MALTQAEEDENVECLKVLMSGKPVLCFDKYAKKWVETTSANFLEKVPHRRIPAPVDRPWRQPSDVPAEANWLDVGGTQDNLWHARIAGILEEGIIVARKMENTVYSWSDLFKYSILWSPDRLTWKPCRTTLP